MIKLLTDEPSHDKNFDTYADDYNSQHGKTGSQSIVGDLSRFSRELSRPKRRDRLSDLFNQIINR